MNSNPLVSIMITSYNQRDSLIRAIESVLSQTYENIQIVISDDHSTKDDSCDVIRKYHKQYGNKIKPIFQKQNVGIPKNKNTGFKACDGDFISYLDGDDFYYPEKIERELKIFEEEKWADIVYSNFLFTDLEGNKLRQWATNVSQLPEKDIFKYVFARQFPHMTIYRCELMKREVLHAIDFYDEKLIAFEDWDSRIRMTKKYKVAYSDYIGCAYVDDPSGISKSGRLQSLYEQMQYIYKKNKPLIDPTTDMLISQKLDRFLDLKQFSAYPSRRTIKNIFQHIIKYPDEIFNKEVWAYLLLNEKMVNYFKGKA